MAISNFGKEIYKGTIWSIIDNFFRQAITFTVFIILARVLNSEIFGLLSVAILIVHVFKSITFDSIATAIIRKEKPSIFDYNTGFWLCISLSIPAFVLLFLLAGSIEGWMNLKGLEGALKGISIIILTSGLCRMHEVWLTHKMDFKSLAIRSTISVILGGIGGIVLALRGYGIEAVVAQHLVTSFSELLLLWIITPWRPAFQASKKSFFEIFHFSKHVSLTSITNFANQNSDTFFVSYYLGASATGFYTTGKRVSNTLNMVLSAALMRVSLPAFSRLQSDNEALQKVYLNAVGLTAMVTAPMFIGLAVLAEDITLLILGEKWIRSVPIMQIITIIGFLTSIGYYNQSIMLAKNKPHWQTRLTLVYAVSNVIAFVIFTKYGLIYTAFAYSGRALLLFPISVWCALTLTKIKWIVYVKRLFPALTSATLMALTVIAISKFIEDYSVVLRLILLIPSGAISYFLFMSLFLPKPQKKMIIRILQDKLKKQDDYVMNHK